MDEERDAIAKPRGSLAPAAEDYRGSYDGKKPLQEIEEDIARTRVRLSAMIEALECELTPRRAIDNAAEALRNSLEVPLGPSRDQISAYAIPLSLIATGLAWLFMLRRRKWQAEASADPSDSPADAGRSGRGAGPCGNEPEG